MRNLILILALFSFSFTLELRADDPPPPTEITPSEGFFSDIIDWFVEKWDALICSIKKVMRWLISLVENIFFYILDITSQALLGLIIIVLDLIPEISLDMTPIQSVYSGINYFVPITECLSIALGLFIFQGGVIVVRWLLKVTPFIG